MLPENSLAFLQNSKSKQNSLNWFLFAAQTFNAGGLGGGFGGAGKVKLLTKDEQLMISKLFLKLKLPMLEHNRLMVEVEEAASVHRQLMLVVSCSAFK